MVLKITNLHILKYLPTCWLYLLERYTIDNQWRTHTASGNTEKAAQQVASIVSGDLHKIQPEKSYTSADLNWRDKSSRSSVEMDDPTSRPAFIDDLKNLAE